MYKRISTVLFSLMACAASQAQSTSPSNTYLLIAGGQSSTGIDCSGTTSCNDTDTGFKVVGGWRINDNTALELGYLALGKASASDGGDPRVDFEANAVTFGAAWGGEFSPAWSGFVRVGVASVNTEVDVVLFGDRVSDSERTAQLHLGLGLAYAVSSSMSIELGWDTTRGEIVGEKSTINLYTLGVNFKF